LLLLNNINLKVKKLPIAEVLICSYNDLMMGRTLALMLFSVFTLSGLSASAAPFETPKICETYCCYKCGCEGLTGCTSPDRPKTAFAAPSTNGTAIPADETLLGQ